MNDRSTAKRILIADDEPLYLRTTGQLLEKAGYECLCVSTAQGALETLRQHKVDLILSDLNMPGNLKLELLKEGRAEYPDVPLIVVTGVPSLPTAIESVRLGIADYLLKPVRFEDLLHCIQRVLNSKAVQETGTPESQDLSPDALSQKFDRILGNSEQIHRVLEIVERVSQSDANVLITGESGTGKEVVARTIHEHSRRSENNFQVIDCTALPESLFESVLFGHSKGAFTGAVKDQKGLLSSSDGGTAFLDELGELPLPSQAKLLRAVQEQAFVPVGHSESIKINTRYICATNRDLHEEMSDGRFRQDLYYRLAVIHLELPPLRDREDDVVLLAQHFLTELQRDECRVTRFSDEVLDRFLDYDWPGNLRELRNVIERSITLSRGDTVHLEDLPVPLRERSFDKTRKHSELGEISRVEALDDADNQYLLALLEKHAGNVSRAANQAGLSRQGMHKLLNKHGIDPQQFRS